MPPEQLEDSMRTPPEKSTQNATGGDDQQIFAEVKDGSADAISSLDPQEIINASIEFQIAHNLPPSRRSMEDGGYSRQSLYPPLSCFEQLEESFDVDEIWEAASRNSKKQHTFMKTFPSIDDSSNLDTAEAKSLLRLSSVASLPTSSVTSAVACASMPSAGNPCRDNDLIAEKLAAYSGGQGSSRHSSSDEDMISMKIAAYEGYSTCGQEGARTRLPEQQGDVSSFVEYCTHPSDASSTSVHAELVAPDSRPDAILSTTEQPYCDTTQATILEYEPRETAMAELWSSSHATVATVLQDDGIQNDNIDLDSKPPARDYGSDGEYGCDTQAEATIIGYDAHPAELAMDAVQAEYVGHDFHSSIHLEGNDIEEFISAEASEVTSSSTSAINQINVEAAIEQHITEVNVIESGPMEKATTEAWSASNSREAQVLQETTANQTPPFDPKLPADSIADDSWRVETHDALHGFAMMDVEAEVVGISEDFHPSEFIGEGTTEAELVCSDFNTAIAIPSNDQDHFEMSNHSSCAIEHADIVVEAGYQNTSITLPPQTRPQEAHATLINDAQRLNFENQMSDLTHVTAVLESFSISGRSISNPLPATTVTVLPVEEPSPIVPPRVSFGESAKPQPFSGRIVSAPLSTTHLESAPETSQDANALSNQQPDWERAPSFGGNGVEDAPFPIPPPIASATPLVEPVPPPIPTPRSVAEGSTASQNRNRSSTSTTSDSSVPGLQMVSKTMLSFDTIDIGLKMAASFIRQAIVQYCTGS